MTILDWLVELLQWGLIGYLLSRERSRLKSSGRLMPPEIQREVADLMREERDARKEMR